MWPFRSRNRSPRESVVVLPDAALCIERYGLFERHRSVRWDQIVRIDAFKCGSITFDEHCIGLYQAERTRPFVASEFMAGYNEFVAAIEARFPGIRKMSEWYSLVANPSCVPCCETIWCTPFPEAPQNDKGPAKAGPLLSS
jgi:hypothetical protein